jgi:hypothetical protein
MKTVEDYEQIRRVFFVEGLSIRAIHRQLKVDRETIRKAIVQPAPQPPWRSGTAPAEAGYRGHECLRALSHHGHF